MSRRYPKPYPAWIDSLPFPPGSMFNAFGKPEQDLAAHFLSPCGEMIVFYTSDTLATKPSTALRGRSFPFKRDWGSFKSSLTRVNAAFKLKRMLWRRPFPGLAPANELEPGITFYTRDDLLRLPQPLAVVPVTKERLFETKSEPY